MNSRIVLLILLCDGCPALKKIYENVLETADKTQLVKEILAQIYDALLGFFALRSDVAVIIEIMEDVFGRVSFSVANLGFRDDGELRSRSIADYWRQSGVMTELFHYLHDRACFHAGIVHTENLEEAGFTMEGAIGEIRARLNNVYQKRGGNVFKADVGFLAPLAQRLAPLLLKSMGVNADL